jgi:hypothetical protein
MPERPDQPRFKEELLDDGPRLAAAAEAEAEPDRRNSSPDTAPAPAAIDGDGQSDGTRQPAGASKAPAEPAAAPAAETSSQNEVRTDGLPLENRKPGNSPHFLPADNMQVKYTRAPYYGLLRHRLIVAACFVFAALVLAMSTVDLKSMVSKPAILQAETTRSGSVLTTEFRTTPVVDAELPANLSYVQSWDQGYRTRERLSEVRDGMRAVVEPTLAGDRFGFVNAAGKVVIKPQFAAVSDFHEGLASVQPPGGGNWGFIDRAGKFVIKPQYSEGSNFRDGVAPVTFVGDNAVRYAALIDRKGHVIVQSKSSKLPVALGPVYCMEESGKCGMVDRTGSWLAPPQYEKIEQFPYESRGFETSNLLQEQPDADLSASDTHFLVARDGRYGVIDSSGKIVTPIKFSHIVGFSHGAAMITDNSKYGFVGADGNYIVKPELEDATAFGELTAVKDTHARWYVINDRGQRVETTDFDLPLVGNRLDWFSEGLAPVCLDGKVGFINTNGQFEIMPQFKLASAFKEGYAAVWDGAFWRFIDRNGRFVLPDKFETVSPFFHGKSRVAVPGPLSFLNSMRIADDVNTRVDSIMGTSPHSRH